MESQAPALAVQLSAWGGASLHHDWGQLAARTASLLFALGVSLVFVKIIEHATAVGFKFLSGAAAWCAARSRQGSKATRPMAPIAAQRTIPPLSRPQSQEAAATQKPPAGLEEPQYDSDDFWNFDTVVSSQENEGRGNSEVNLPNGAELQSPVSFWDLAEPAVHVHQQAQHLSGADSSMVVDVERNLDIALVSGDEKLADSVVSLGLRFCSPDWVARACSKLRYAGIALNADRTLMLVQGFSQRGHADLAIDLWQISPVEMFHLLYGAVLEACISSGDFESAGRAVTVAKGVPPSCVEGRRAFLSLIRWFARHAQLDRATECFFALKAATGAPPDSTTTRVLLRALARHGSMEQAELMFQELEGGAAVPEATEFAAMVRGFRAAGDWDKAMAYFHAMQDNGISPDVSLYDAILDGCLSRSLPGLLDGILVDMSSKGVTPSNTTLVTLIRLYGQSHDVDAAVNLLNKWQLHHGIEADVKAYSILIRLCIQNQRLELALEAFDKMTASGFRANVHIYERLIQTCMRHGDLERAVSITTFALNGQKTNTPDELSPESAQGQMRDFQQQRPLAHVDIKCIESLLKLLGQRGQVTSLGIPLLNLLQDLGVEVSQKLAESLRRVANEEAAGKIGWHEAWDTRRRERQLWRDFRHA